MKLSTLWIKLMAEQINPAVYLEIGVNQAQTFNQVKCGHAIGVDPNIECLKHIDRKDYTFYNITSDDFFNTKNTVAGRVELAFIDGLHTGEQALKDFYNTMRFLAPSGWIILHDTWPPDKRHMESDRCGSVYTATEEIKAYCNNEGLDHLTLPWAFGLTVVRRGHFTNQELL